MADVVDRGGEEGDKRRKGAAGKHLNALL